MCKAISNLSADEIFRENDGGLLGVDYLLIACHGQAGLARPRLSPSIFGMVGDTAASTNLVFESPRIAEKNFRCGWAPSERLATAQSW